MTSHTKGWVEVPHPFGDPLTARWEGILNLEPLLAWHAFEEAEWAALNRALVAGFPGDVSELAQAEYSAQQAVLDANDIGILTPPRWTTLAELRAIMLPLKDLHLSKSAVKDWTTLMRLLDIFARRYGDKRVRIILWSSVVM